MISFALGAVVALFAQAAFPAPTAAVVEYIRSTVKAVLIRLGFQKG